MKKLVLTLFVIFTLIGCISNKQNKGFVTPESSETTIGFTTNRTVIILPVLVDGVPKNYAFDTGAELSVVHREKTIGKTKNITGAGGNKEKLGSETIKSLKIGNIEYNNTSALNGNLTYMTTQIPKYGGILGQSIIVKSNWLIDYTKNKITISPKTIKVDDFETLTVKNLRDPHVNITIEGETHSFLVDLGSSVAMSIPENSKLAKKLLAKYAFVDNKREIFRIGGVENVNEKIGKIERSKIDNTIFGENAVHILPTKSLKIGNAFFKDYMLYIDNTNGDYKIKKSKN